jgi:hypothetical protein
MAFQLITQKFYKFFPLLACLAIFPKISASGTIDFYEHDMSSVATAFTFIQQRQNDDPIAKEIVAKSAQTLKGKAAALHQFNERLRKRHEENEKLAAQGLSPVRTGEDYASKLIAKKAAEAAEMQRKLQAGMNEEREQQRLELERKEKLLQEKENALAKIKDEVASLVDRAAALSPLRIELAQERARERVTPLKKKVSELTARESALEAELKRLKSQMGCDVLATILEERPESADDGFAGGGFEGGGFAGGGFEGGGFAGGGVNLDEVAALKLDLASYYKKIKDINKRLEKLAEVLSDCDRVQALFNESLKHIETTTETIEEIFGRKTIRRDIIRRLIPDREVAEVLMHMREACSIANKYKPTAFEGAVKQVRDGLETVLKMVDGTKEKMEKASPEERVVIFSDAFLNIYTEIPNNEKMTIGTIDHLQLSLDLTLNLEASILSTKKLGLYPDSDFLSIDQTITSAISSLREKIKEQDKAVFDGYMSILAEERKLLVSVTDFSVMPLTVQLLRDYRVLFMFKRPAKKDEADNERTTPFASFGRISDEIRYLTENQKKALFASLYYVVFNYEDVSGSYLRDTLLSNTPIQAVDIHPLIKQLKEALKTNSAAEKFVPIVMTQKSLREFSTKVDRLISGETYRESVTNRFVNALIGLGQKLDGISQEGIVEYLKPESLAEEKRTNAGRILAEHDFISTEALNQQLVAKRKAHDSYVSSLEQSILEKGQREEEARIITAELEEGTLAKLNAQREKKEKEVEIETFSKTVEEHNKEQLAELGQKYEQLNELENKLIILNKSLAELGKKSKKLTNEIELSTKKIQSLETNIEVIVPEIENLADALRKLGFVSELERLSDDIDGIASRGQELFDFNRTLESCFELLTALQSSTKKLVEAEEATVTEGTSSASIAKTGSITDRLGREEKRKIEDVLRKASGTADSDLAAQNAKKLKAMALIAAKEKREADAQEKKKADELAAGALTAKPLARPLAFAAPVASSSVVDGFRNIVNVAKAKLATLTEISAEDREEIEELISRIEADIANEKITFTGTIIKKLEKNALLAAVVLPPAPAVELSEKEKAANVKKEEAKIKLLSTIEALTQQLEAKKSAISEDEYAELSATLVSTKKMINEGNAMAQVAIRGLKSSIE